MHALDPASARFLFLRDPMPCTLCTMALLHRAWHVNWTWCLRRKLGTDPGTRDFARKSLSPKPSNTNLLSSTNESGSGRGARYLCCLPAHAGTLGLGGLGFWFGVRVLGSRSKVSGLGFRFLGLTAPCFPTEGPLACVNIPPNASLGYVSHLHVHISVIKKCFDMGEVRMDKRVHNV